MGCRIRLSNRSLQLRTYVSVEGRSGWDTLVCREASSTPHDESSEQP